MDRFNLHSNGGFHLRTEPLNSADKKSQSAFWIATQFKLRKTASPSPVTTATSLSSSESKDRKHAHGNAGDRKMNSAVKQKRTITHPAVSPSPGERIKVRGFPAKPKVGMISLGCAKNLVDAEIMLGSVLAHGMEISSSADDADVLVVNTCAFIDSAKEESIEASLTAHQARGLNRRPSQKLIVSGCMSQRFALELREEMPEVDAFVGLDEVKELGAIVERVIANDDVDLAFADTRPTYIPDYDTPRFRLTPALSAYVKIAEGCNHPCSFCVIPQMRGKHRSRTMESVLTEIRGLVAEGVREINLISQDTTYYGMDLWNEKAGPRQPVDSARGPTLVALLRAIQEIDGDFWVRLLYTHPAHWSDELIETIADCDKVARYIDIPLQHIHEAMLIQQRIAHALAREKIGRDLKLLIDQPLIARTEADAPDLDTRVILAKPEPVGDFVVKRISGARGYDLLA